MFKRPPKVLHRFTEGSTYAGLAAALGTISTQAPPVYQETLWAVTGACALLAVLLREGP